MRSLTIFWYWRYCICISLIIFGAVDLIVPLGMTYNLCTVCNKNVTVYNHRTNHTVQQVKKRWIGGFGHHESETVFDGPLVPQWVRTLCQFGLPDEIFTRRRRGRVLRAHWRRQRGRGGQAVTQRCDDRRLQLDATSAREGNGSQCLVQVSGALQLVFDHSWKLITFEISRLLIYQP